MASPQSLAFEQANQDIINQGGTLTLANGNFISGLNSQEQFSQGFFKNTGIPLDAKLPNGKTYKEMVDYHQSINDGSYVPPAPTLATTTTKGTETKAPTVINSGDAPVKGGPTTPATAAGVLTNTTLDKMNNSLAHVCDIAGPMVYGIAWASFKIGEAIQAIRTFLEGLWGSVSSSPFGDAIRGAIKFIKAKIALARKFLKQVQEAVAAVQKFINEVKQLIALIATYPARIAAILIGCVKQAMADIALSEENKKLLDTAINSGSAKTVAVEQVSAEKSLSENESIVENPTRQITPVMEAP
jgi:hypothetical protein